MKNYLLTIALFAGSFAFSQPLQPEPLPDNEPNITDAGFELAQHSFEQTLIAAFKTGNASSIAKYFSSNVDMSIDGKENLYSNKQAEQVLKNFFLSNKPSDFSMIHKGKSGQSEYFIGELASGSGLYRVTINSKASGGNKEITSLTIEKS